MAILKLGALVTQMSGKIGGQSISNRSSYTTIRNIVQTNKIPTQKQSKQRLITSEIASSWRFITQVQRNNWDVASVDYKYQNRVGDEITRNGFQSYVFCNQNLTVISQNIIDSPPLYIPVSVPKINVTNITLANFVIQSNNSSSDYLYALFGVANLSFGKKANKGLLKYIGAITSAQLLAGYDVVGDLEAVFGTLTFPNKMSITVDPINLTTGNRNQFSSIIENSDAPMIIEVLVADGDTITIPFQSGGSFNGSVNYGDGMSATFNAYNSVGLTHTYVNGGSYLISISGEFTRFSVNNGSFKNYFANVIQFGSNLFSVLNFYGCLLFTNVTPNDTPSFTGVLNGRNLFRNTTNMLTFSNINSWDMTLFNTLQASFSASSFNDQIGSWNLINVVSTFQMFQGASNFNQDINNWQLPLVTNARAMFQNALQFNNGGNSLANFNLPLATTARDLFRNTSFNQPVTSLSLPSNTNVFQMFELTPFNQPLDAMLCSLVTNLSQMFNANLVFDQDISHFDLQNATTMSSFNARLSTANYNSFLIAMNSLPVVPFNLTMSMLSTYTAGGSAETARTNLVATHSWNITDLGSI